MRTFITHSFIHSLGEFSGEDIHSLIHPLGEFLGQDIHSLIHSLIHSFIHSLGEFLGEDIHSFVHSLGEFLRKAQLVVFFWELDEEADDFSRPKQKSTLPDL